MIAASVADTALERARLNAPMMSSSARRLRLDRARCFRFGRPRPAPDAFLFGNVEHVMGAVLVCSFAARPLALAFALAAHPQIRGPYVRRGHKNACKLCLAPGMRLEEAPGRGRTRSWSRRGRASCSLRGYVLDPDVPAEAAPRWFEPARGPASGWTAIDAINTRKP